MISRDIDDGLYYVELEFSDKEWVALFNDNGINFGKLQLWSKCNIKGIIRSYYSFDSNPHKVKFVDHTHSETIDKKLQLYHDNVRINTTYTRAGGEFFINTSSSLKTSIDDFLTISIKGIKENIKIPHSICYEKRDQSIGGYIMSLRTYDRGINNNTILHVSSNETEHCINSSIAGLANNFDHNFCLLSISKYDVLLQESYISIFMQNPVISNAVNSGHLTFVTKNNHFTKWNSNDFDGKYYNLFMNLQVLRYWDYDDARLFFWDTDEFINVSPFQLKHLHQIIKTNSLVSFEMNSIICLDCDASTPDFLSLFQNGHTLGQRPSSLGKISLNPNEAGLMFIQSALLTYGNSVKSIKLDSAIAYICRFENYYHQRVSVNSNVYKKVELPNFHLSCQNSPFQIDHDKMMNRIVFQYEFYFYLGIIMLIVSLTYRAIKTKFRPELYNKNCI